MPIPLTIEFEFEIGEIVYFRTAEHNLFRQPIPCIVEAHRADSCVAGTQKFYKLCSVANYHPEMHLTRTKPEFSRVSDEYLCEKIRIEEAIRGASIPL